MKVEWIEIIEIVIIFQLLIFIISLLTKKPHHISNRILACFLFSHAAGSFCDLSYLQNEFFFVENPHFAFLGYPFVFLWGPVFYLYVLSVMYKDMHLKLMHFLHLIPFILFLSFFSATIYFNSVETKIMILHDASYPIFSYNTVIDIFFKLQILFYIVISFYTLYSVQNKLKENYSSISKVSLSWLKFIIIGYSVCYFVSISFSFTVYVLNTFNKLFFLVSYLQYFIYFNIIFFKAWNQPQIFSGLEETPKYKNSKLTKEEASCWIDKLNDYMCIKKSYLNPELTLNQLSGDLNIHPRILSQILNEYFDQNFYDYINRLRVEESKKMLCDQSNRKTILEILNDTGFNSKATFNRAFRKETGLSPTEYRKRFAKESILSSQN